MSKIYSLFFLLKSNNIFQIALIQRRATVTVSEAHQFTVVHNTNLQLSTTRIFAFSELDSPVDTFAIASSDSHHVSRHKALRIKQNEWPSQGDCDQRCSPSAYECLPLKVIQFALKLNQRLLDHIK